MAPWGSTRRPLLGVSPMPVIAEDETASPLAPPPPAVRGGGGPGPGGQQQARCSSAGTPPPASRRGEKTAPDRMVLPHRAAFRDQREISRRRGWHRLAMALLLVTALVVGLAVGLSLGLRRHQASSLPGTAAANSLFPAGSYSFTAALLNASSGCAASPPSAFRCYPLATYDPLSPDASAATFRWVITAVSSYAYTIASSAGAAGRGAGEGGDPSAPSFRGVNLTLLDGNSAAERLVFRLAGVTRAVAVPLPGNNGTAGGGSSGSQAAAATTCYFNSTVLTATLWTRRRAEYPRGAAALPDPVNASSAFAPWPYAAEIAQTQAAGAGVPDCRDAAGRAVGPPGALGGAGQCGCWYANAGLPGGTAAAAAAAGRAATWGG